MIRSLVALQAGGYTHSWHSAYVLCCLVIGLSLVAAWIVWEAMFAPYPMVPGALFRGQRIVAIAFATAFVGGMNFYSVLNFLPITWSDVYPNDPVQVGLKGLPPAISMTMGAIVFNVALSTFKNNNREVLLTAAVIMTAFTGALAAMTPDNPKLTVALATLSGLGVGGMIVPTATVALLVTPDALLTTTAALSLTVRSVGGAVGYCTYYNIFRNKLTTKIPALAAEYAIKAGLPSADARAFLTILLDTPALITTAPGFSPPILEAAELGIRWAYAESLHFVWYTTTAFGFCAIICCLFLPSTAKYQTNRIAVAL